MLKKIVSLVLASLLVLVANNTTMATGLTSQGVFKLSEAVVPGLADRSQVYQEKVYQVVDMGRIKQLQIIGFDDPVRPSLAGAFDFEASQIIDVAIVNKLAVIGIENSSSEHVVLLVSLENEAAPKIVSRVTVKTGIRRLALVKKSLLVMSENVIMVYDVSRPSSPQFVNKMTEMRSGYVDLAVADRWIGILHYPAGGQAKLLVYKLAGDELTKVASEITSQFAEQVVAVSNFSEQQFVVVGSPPQGSRGKIYFDAYTIGPFGETKPATGLPQFNQSQVASIYSTTENELQIFLATREHHWQRGSGKVIPNLQMHFLQYGNKKWQSAGQIKLLVDLPRVMQMSGRQLRVYGFDKLDQPVVEIFDF